MLQNPKKEFQELELSGSMLKLLVKAEKIVEDYSEDNFVCLRKTTLISDETLNPNFDNYHSDVWALLEGQLWLLVKQFYQSNDRYLQALASVINSILTQHSNYFCLTQRSLYKLIKDDQNLAHKPWKMDTKQYSRILSFFYKNLIFIRLDKSTNKKPGVFKVVNIDLQKFLNFTFYSGDAIDPKLKKALDTHLLDEYNQCKEFAEKGETFKRIPTARE